MSLTLSDADTCIAIVLADDLERDSPAPRLTRKQVIMVHELIIDEGFTRTEAIAWVRS